MHASPGLCPQAVDAEAWEVLEDESTRGSWGARVPWSSPAGPCGSMESTTGPSLSKSTGRPPGWERPLFAGARKFPSGATEPRFLERPQQALPTCWPYTQEPGALYTCSSLAAGSLSAPFPPCDCPCSRHGPGPRRTRRVGPGVRLPAAVSQGASGLSQSLTEPPCRRRVRAGAGRGFAFCDFALYRFPDHRAERRALESLQRARRLGGTTELPSGRSCSADTRSSVLTPPWSTLNQVSWSRTTSNKVMW